MRPEKVTQLSLKTVLLLILQILLACLAIGIAAVQIGKYTDSLEADLLVRGAPWLFAAAVIYILFYGLLAIHWQYIARHIDPNASRYQWLAFFAAQPYKYLPTSIFTLTFRAKYAGKLGMSIKRSSLAQFVENISMLAAATAIALPVWLFSYGRAVLGTLAFLVCLAGFIVGFEILSKIKYGIHFPVKKRFVIFLLALAAWSIAGVAFFMVAIGLREDMGIIEAVGANAAAFEAGIIAVFAPGGIGVREFIFGLFGVGALSIIAWRLVTALVDIIVGPLAWVIIQRVAIKE